MSQDDFLARWSKRKHAARRGEAAPDAEPANREAAAPEGGEPRPAAAGTAPPPEPLPPVESLTPDSDFSPFMRSDVDPGMRRQALKALFRDPRFNVMDGLDTYIDDYSRPDPIPAEWLGKLNQLARLGHFDGEQAAETGRQAPEAAEIPSTEQGNSAPAEGSNSDTSDAGGNPPESAESENR